MDFIALFALVLFVYQGWFKPGIITYVDLFYPPTQWVAEKVALPYAWSNEHGGYYGGLWQAVQYYPNFLWGFLVQVAGLGIDTAMRAVWLIPFIFIAIPGMYYLAHVLFGRRFVSFLAAAFLPLSSMAILTNHQGFAALSISLALSLWMLAFFYRGLRRRRLRDAVIAGLFLAAAIAYDIKIAILGGGLVVFFAAYWLVTEGPLAEGRGLGWKDVWYLARPIALVALVGFALHLQSLLPAVFSGALAIPRGGEEPAWVNVASYNSVLDVIMLTTGYWVNQAQITLVGALGIAVLVFAAPILRPRDRRVILLTLLALLLIFMAKGAEPPFGGLYTWLYARIPGFVAFRDTNKFILALLVPYALLFAVSVDTIAGCYRWGRARLVQGAAIFLVLALMLWTISPTFMGPDAHDRTNPVGSSFQPHPVPPEYQRIYQWMEGLSPDQGILASPANTPYLLHSERNFGINNHWHIVLGSFFDFGRYFVVSGYNHYSVMERRLTHNIGAILGLTNIKYVVIKPIYDVDWGASTLNRPDFILQGYEEQRDLTRLPEFKEAGVFRNEKALPRLYSPSRAAAMVGGRNTLLSLALLETDFSQWAFFYPGLAQEGFMDIWGQMDTVIFSDKGLDDLIMSSVGKAYRIDLFPYTKAAEKGRPSEQRFYDYWDETETGWFRIQSQYWNTERGEVFESHGGLIQGGTPMARLAVPWTAKEAGAYEVWLRMGVGHDIEFLRNIGAVSVHLDRSLIGYLSSYSPDFVGLRWVRAGTIEVAAGEHLVELFNRADTNTLDKLIIIPQKALAQHDTQIRSALPSKTLIHLQEGEKSFFRENINWSISDKYGAAASQGYVLTTSAPQESATTTLELATRDDYRLALRAAGEGFAGRVTIAVDDREVLATSWEGRPQGQMLWLETSAIPLIAGPHQVKITKTGSGAFYLDLLMAHNTRSPVEELWRPKAAGPTLTWETVNPTEYRVQLKTEKPTFLLMPLNYNALWYAEVGSKKSPSLNVNSYGNAFLVDNPEGKGVTLRFAAQSWTERGLYLSLAVMVGLAGYLLATSRRGRRMLSALRQRRGDGA